MNDERRCVSCGAVVTGRWCQECGEKVLTPEDNTVSHYVREISSELFGTDSRLYRTLLALAFRPGYLTAEYLKGRRKTLLGPVALFLLMNVSFFVIQPLVNINTFNATLHAQTQWYPYSDWADAVVQSSVAASDLAYEDYESVFNERSEGLAKSLVFLQIPMLALCIMALRLPRPTAYFSHLVFSTHLYSLILLLNTLLSAGVYMYWFAGGNAFDFEIPMLIVFAIYFTLAMRGAYGDGWVVATTRGLATLFLFGGVLFVYRLLLLILTVQSFQII